MIDRARRPDAMTFMRGRRKYAARRWWAIVVMAAAFGCASDQIKANQDQLAQQQIELDRLKQEVAALQAQNPGPVGLAPPGACDDTVMRAASRKGGERFAANDLPHALAYYQDAVNACPANSRAQIDLARTYELLGDSAQARNHYQAVAAASGADANAVKEARDALTRLHP